MKNNISTNISFSPSLSPAKGDNMIFVVLVTLNTTILLVAMCLHLLGIYVIVNIEDRKRRNQHIILLHLSVSEVMMILSRVPCQIIFAVLESPAENAYFNFMFTFSILVFMPPYILIMMLMSLDRVLVILLKMKYRQTFNSKRLKSCLIGCWILGSLPGGLCQITQGFHFRILITKKYFTPVSTSVFVVHTTVMYIIIFFGYRRQQHHLANIKQPSHIRVANSPKLRMKTPTLIITTFVVFMLIPTALNYTVNMMNARNASILIALCYSLGLLSDSIIYTYFNVTIRNTFKKICKVEVTVRDRRAESCTSLASVSQQNANRRRKLGICNNALREDTKF